MIPYCLSSLVVLLLFCLLSKSTKLLVGKNRSRLSRLQSIEIESCAIGSQRVSEFVWEVKNSGEHEQELTYVSGIDRVVTEYARHNNLKQLVEGVKEFFQQKSVTSAQLLAQSWGLTFLSLSSISGDTLSHDSRQFSAKTVYCSLAAAIGGSPALYTSEIVTQFILIETENYYHFGKEEWLSASAVDTIKQSWKNRPFQYSGALHYDISLPIANIIYAELSKRSPLVLTTRKFFLDPCCGSGTNLMMAGR